MIRYRYTMWDGSQEPFYPSPDDILEGLTDYLLQDGDVQKALRLLMRRGMTDRQDRIMPGLQDILNKVRRAKEDLLRQYNPDGVLSDLQRQLDDIVTRERQALEAQLTATQQRLAQIPQDHPDAAQQRANEARAIQEMEEIVADHHDVLDHLPRDVAETMRRLCAYEFVDRQAKADFDVLVQALQQQALDALFQTMQQRLQHMRPEDLQRMRQMLEDLNALLDQRGMGEQTDFQDS